MSKKFKSIVFDHSDVDGQDPILSEILDTIDLDYRLLESSAHLQGAEHFSSCGGLESFESKSDLAGRTNGQTNGRTDGRTTVLRELDRLRL